MFSKDSRSHVLIHTTSQQLSANCSGGGCVRTYVPECVQGHVPAILVFDDQLRDVGAFPSVSRSLLNVRNLVLGINTFSYIADATRYVGSKLLAGFLPNLQHFC